MTEKEISAVALEYYPRLGNRNKMFDMTRASLSALTPNDLTAVARTVATAQPDGAFPKTALVAGELATYATLSRYLLHVFHNRVPVEYRVFTDVALAEAWLEDK